MIGVSVPASHVPLLLTSVNISQPLSQLAPALELVHELASTFLTVTGIPRLSASLRARFKAVTSKLALVVNRLLEMVDIKLGMAMAKSIAAMDTVIMSSGRVKPESSFSL